MLAKRSKLSCLHADRKQKPRSMRSVVSTRSSEKQDRSVMKLLLMQWFWCAIRGVRRHSEALLDYTPATHVHMSSCKLQAENTHEGACLYPCILLSGGGRAH